MFDEIAAVDSNLGRQTALTGRYRGTMRAATRDLRGMINRGEMSAGRFTPAQLRAIRGGRAQTPGYTWHHHQNIGRMQLVPREAAQRSQSRGWVGALSPLVGQGSSR
ncbi:MAG: hypothetical protein EVA89_21815 [Sandaracinaceae bacterium]|nr:MAG: hypothetical protein EVA89_21815 [Sandaracinaceae bacterium]